MSMQQDFIDRMPSYESVRHYANELTSARFSDKARNKNKTNNNTSITGLTSGVFDLIDNDKLTSDIDALMDALKTRNFNNVTWLTDSKKVCLLLEKIYQEDNPIINV